MDAFRSNVLKQETTLNFQAGRLDLTVGCTGLKIQSEHLSLRASFPCLSQIKILSSIDIFAVSSACVKCQRNIQEVVSHNAAATKRLCCQEAGSCLIPTGLSQLVGVGHVQLHSNGISKQLSDSDSICQSLRDFYLSAP